MIASFDYNPAHTGQFLMNCLAILGGFLLGYLISALLANLADRSLFRRKTPRLVHRGLRILGGVALAFLIAGIVFSTGQGWHLFGGGSEGTGNANDTGSPQLISTTAPSPERPLPPATDRIRITILGGTDVVAEKFYLIDDDTAPRTIAELKEIIKAKAAALAKPLIELQFSAKNVLPLDHPAVRMLEVWIQNEAKLGYSFPADGR